MPCGQSYPMVSANGNTAACNAAPGYGLGGPKQLGVISHGAFTPLPTPKGIFPVSLGLVAW